MTFLYAITFAIANSVGGPEDLSFGHGPSTWAIVLLFVLGIDLWASTVSR